mgnify:CR=1 FL=1
MCIRDRYDKRLLEGIETISDRLDKIEKKMPGEVDQERSVILSALYSLAKENNCSISIGIYPNNCVLLKVRIGSMKQLEIGVTDSNCSEEKLLSICTDIIRMAKVKNNR